VASGPVTGKATPSVGEWVCTCRFEHEQIVRVDDDGDTVVTTSGWVCSYAHCCDPIDHEWSHTPGSSAADS
jgi:hypothetical protein